MPKYVASRTLTRLDWENAHLLGPDLAAEVTRLKAEIDGDIVVTGSADLVGDLYKLGLVDEFEFQVFPIVLGSGKRLFPSGLDMRHFQLVGSRAFPKGVVVLRYEPSDRGTQQRVRGRLPVDARPDPVLPGGHGHRTGARDGAVHRHRRLDPRRGRARRSPVAPAARPPRPARPPGGRALAGSLHQVDR